MAAAVQKVRMRTSWLQWLLLVVQSLILALLGVSLASPTGSFRSLTGTTEDSSRLCWILVLDDSASMDYLANGQSHFRQSVEQALDVVRELSRRDAVALVSMAGENPDVIGAPTFNHEIARQQLEDWVTKPHQADLGRTLTFLQQQVNAIQSSGVAFNQIRVLFWSDLSEKTWQVITADELTRQFETLERGAVAQVIDLGNFSSGNVTVEKMASLRRFAAEDRPFELSSFVTNQDSKSEAVVPLRVYVDGEFQLEKKVSLRPLETQRVSLPLSLRGQGRHWVKIELPSDTLPSDNQGWAVVEVPGDLEVIVWTDQVDERVYLEQGFNALSRQGIKLNVQKGTPEDLERFRSPYTIMVVGTVSEVTPTEAEALRTHLKNQGGILVFAGAQAMPWQTLGAIQPSWSNAAAWRALTGSRLELDWPEPTPPMMSGFSRRAQETILQTPVWGQWSLPETGDVPVEPGLETRQAGVLLGTLLLEQGQCVFWLSGLEAESANTAEGQPWSALTLWPSFIPLLSRMLEEGLGNAAEFNQTIPRFAEESMETTADLRRWTRVAPPADTADESPSSAQQAGIYSENLGLGQVRLHALNVDGVEFQGDRVFVESLPEWFYSSQDLESVPQENLAEGGPLRWYQALLLMVVVLMALELGFYRQLRKPSTRFARWRPGRAG